MRNLAVRTFDYGENRYNYFLFLKWRRAWPAGAGWPGHEVIPVRSQPRNLRRKNFLMNGGEFVAAWRLKTDKTRIFRTA